MCRLSKYINYNNILLSTVLATFSIATINPQPAYAIKNNIFPNVQFAKKIQKLIDKVNKYKDKLDADSLLDTVLEIKEEIESQTGKKFDLDKEVDRVEQEIKKRGGKTNKNNFHNFKKIISGRIKKQKQRGFLFECYLKDEISRAINFEEYETLYLFNDRAQKVEEPQVPYKIYIGITLMLGGAFLLAAGPVCPLCIPAGEMMMGTGFGFVTDEGLDMYMDDKKKK